MKLLTPQPETDTQRVNVLIAKLRTKQLESALRGRVIESARYASRAHRIRAVGTQKAAD